MPPKFSTQDHSTLFGVGFDLNTHLERLQAAQNFYEVRKDIEKAKTRLASLTARNFKQRSSLFRENVEEAVREGPENGHRTLLLPFIQDTGTSDGIRHFVLASLMLSKAHCKNLEKASLVGIFRQLFRGVIGTIAVLPETMTAALAAIEEVCVRMDSPSSKHLLSQSSKN